MIFLNTHMYKYILWSDVSKNSIIDNIIDDDDSNIIRYTIYEFTASSSHYYSTSHNYRILYSINIKIHTHVHI